MVLHSQPGHQHQSDPLPVCYHPILSFISCLFSLSFYMGLLPMSFSSGSHAPGSSHFVSKPLQLGIAGLGTVGTGVIRMIREHRQLLQKRTGRSIEIRAVSARHPKKDRGLNLSGLTWYDNPSDMVQDPAIDVIIELIGGAEGAARALVEAGLKAGKPVITANKALIAHHASTLMALSDAHQAPLLFEASVAGAIPAIKLIREAMAGENLHYVGGILNGTCNYILSEMQKTGRSFDDVLAEAQAKGYAEAEPSTDIDGWDSAHKLAILAGIAFEPLVFESVEVEGIRNITAADLRFSHDLGYIIKLLGLVRRTEDGLVAWVRPCLVEQHTALAHVDDAFNALSFSGPFCGPMTISGRGAGEGPTATAVLADIVDIARGHKTPLWGRYCPGEGAHTLSTSCLEAQNNAFYLRLIVDDHAGVIADITDILRKAEISVHFISQHDDKTLLPPIASPEVSKPDASVDRVFLTVVTHPVAESKISQVLSQLETLPCVHGTPLSLTIEHLS